MPESNPSTVAAASAGRFTRADWLALLLVVATAFTVRLAYLSQIRDVVFFQYLIVDAERYDQWATEIADGDWIGKEVFYQAPLYPYFLAVCQRIVGHDLWNIRVVQIALGSLACGFLFLAGRWWFDVYGRAVGLCAGLLLALYGPAVFFDGLIQKAVLDGFLGTLLLAVLALHARRARIVTAVVAGLILGAFILTRENALLAYFVIAAWMLLATRKSRDAALSEPDAQARVNEKRAKRAAVAKATLARASGSDAPRSEKMGSVRGARLLKIRDAALFTFGVAAPLIAVGSRNFAVGGEFILTTSQFGPNLYIGNHPGATGVLAPLRAGRDGPRYERIDATQLAESALGRRLSPAEVSRYWVRRVQSYIVSQPLDWLALLGKKAALLMNTHEVVDAEDIYYYERHSWLLRGLLWTGHFGVLLPLAAAGIVLAARDQLRLALLHGLLAAFAIGVVIFYVFGRYRYPLVPPLILFAAFGLVRSAAAIRSRDFRALGVPTVVALVTAVAANWQLRSRTEYLPMSYANAAAALTENGRATEAVAHLQEALRLSPNSADLYLNLGVCHGRMNQMLEAVAALRRAVELRPGDPLLESKLGMALAETGDYGGAATHLLAAWRAWPEDEATARNLIVVLRTLERWSDLAAVLRQRFAADSQSRMRALELAQLLATCRDAAVRDGTLALQLAAAASDARDAHSLDILAAALAEMGRFEEAARTAELAMEAARSSGAGAEEVAAIAARVELYKSGRAFRQ